jgi:putative ABC transport system ATP-binding protein
MTAEMATRTATDWVVRLDGVGRSARTDAGDVTLLAPTTAELRSHTLTVVAGPSGSGKTTLCNVVIGWERPDRGTVEWATGDAAGWARLAVAPQRLALIEALTLAENLALPFWSRRAAVPDTPLQELCAALAIDHLLPRHPSEVSFGEQQRAAIARCLLGAPALCVLDEPTGHQDEARAALVVEQLLAARAAGSCVLVATHDEVVIDAADVLIRLR